MGQQIRSSAEFKQATIQGLLAGEKTGAQLCRERRIDETTLRRWRKEYEQRGVAAWAAPAVENMVFNKAVQLARSLSARGTPSSAS
jgi:transposase-like protein